jgi:hypothetical protein
MTSLGTSRRSNQESAWRAGRGQPWLLRQLRHTGRRFNCFGRGEPGRSGLRDVRVRSARGRRRRSRPRPSRFSLGRCLAPVASTGTFPGPGTRGQTTRPVRTPAHLVTLSRRRAPGHALAATSSRPRPGRPPARRQEERPLVCITAGQGPSVGAACRNRTDDLLNSTLRKRWQAWTTADQTNWSVTCTFAIPISPATSRSIPMPHHNSPDSSPISRPGSALHPAQNDARSPDSFA